MNSIKQSESKWFLLILLAIIWGSSFVLMKIGLKAFTPPQVAAARMTIAGLSLLPFVLKHFSKIEKNKWKYIFASAMLGNCFPAFLFTEAETEVSSATAGMLNSLSPVFTLLIAFFIFKNRPKLYQSLGVFIGLAGAIALIYFQPGASLQANKYAWLIVLATFFYGGSVNVIKNYLTGINSVYVAGFALGMAALPCSAYLFSTDFVNRVQQNEYGWQSLSGTAVLAIFGSAIATILFNQLVKVSSALFAASVTYLIPIVALLLGFFNGEPVNFPQILALIIILGGVYLINFKSKKQI